MTGVATDTGLPSVPTAKGVRLNGAYLVAQDSGTPRTPDFTGAFSMGGLFRPTTIDGPTRLAQKTDNTDLTTEAGIIAWVTALYPRLARVGHAAGVTGVYRSVWEDADGAPVLNKWHSWGWRHDPAAPNPVSTDNPTAIPGRTSVFLNGVLKADRDTSAVTVPTTNAPLVVGAKPDGTVPYLGDISRFWIAEGVALPDSWFARAEQARMTGATALSNLLVSPTAVTVTAVLGSTTIQNAAVTVTQGLAGGNPAFTTSSSPQITVTGGLSAPTTLNLAVDPTGMTATTALTVTVTPAEPTQPAIVIPVTVAITSSVIVASPTSIALTAAAGAAVSNTVRLAVTQTVVGGLTGFTLSSPATWLQITQVP